MRRRSLFSALVRPSQDGHWLRVHRPAMACRFEVVLDEQDARFVPAARAALDEVDAIESALSYFRETSELTRLNREAARAEVRVGESLFALLRLCRELHGLTAGAFDPTSAPYSRAWGFLSREGRLPEPAELAAARACVGMHHVHLDERERTVAFGRQGLELNLGGIGKGWALDRVAGGLRKGGLEQALVSAAGSSHRAWGRVPWRIALRPAGEPLALLRLRDAALGTSGAGEQHFEAGGRRYGHLIDPRTGWPAEGVRSASAIADEAAVADALATACYVGGPALARSVCAARPGTVAILHLEQEPDALHVFGSRDGLAIESADGLRVVHAGDGRRLSTPGSERSS